LGPTSTRSSRESRARRLACSRGTTPIWVPSWSMSRTGLLRIRWLMRGSL